MYGFPFLDISGECGISSRDNYIFLYNQYSNANLVDIQKYLSTKLFDIRKKLPFEDNSVEACYSHMLYCMALSNNDLQNLNNEILRILKPGGINIYTVRHTKDGDYQSGLSRGEDLYENDGFIVHYFSKEKIYSLLKGFENINLENFEEGSFPIKLFYVVNIKKIKNQ